MKADTARKWQAGLNSVAAIADLFQRIYGAYQDRNQKQENRQAYERWRTGLMPQQQVEVPAFAAAAGEGGVAMPNPQISVPGGVMGTPSSADLATLMSMIPYPEHQGVQAMVAPAQQMFETGREDDYRNTQLELQRQQLKLAEANRRLDELKWSTPNVPGRQGFTSEGLDPALEWVSEGGDRSWLDQRVPLAPETRYSPLGMFGDATGVYGAGIDTRTGQTLFNRFTGESGEPVTGVNRIGSDSYLPSGEQNVKDKNASGGGGGGASATKDVKKNRAGLRSAMDDVADARAELKRISAELKKGDKTKERGLRESLKEAEARLKAAQRKTRDLQYYLEEQGVDVDAVVPPARGSAPAPASAPARGSATSEPLWWEK